MLKTRTVPFEQSKSQQEDRMEGPDEGTVRCMFRDR